MGKFKSTQAEIATAKASAIIIEQPKKLVVVLEIRGRTPLIQNCFNQKTIEDMLRKHMGLAVQKEAKKPRDVIERAKVLNTDGAVCIPPQAIKKAMLTAATNMKDKSLAKTRLRAALHIEGGSVPIAYETMTPRMDMVRTSGVSRAPDVRFRPQFDGWSARLSIQFSDTLQVQTVVDLLNRAGDVGVGEWRPEKDGVYGTFEVSRNITSAEEIAEVRKKCEPPVRAPVVPEWAMDAGITPDMLAKIARGEGVDENEGVNGEEEQEQTGT